MTKSARRGNFGNWEFHILLEWEVLMGQQAVVYMDMIGLDKGKDLVWRYFIFGYLFFVIFY
jgi:hypothetical protein